MGYNRSGNWVNSPLIEKKFPPFSVVSKGCVPKSVLSMLDIHGIMLILLIIVRYIVVCL